MILNENILCNACHYFLYDKQFSQLQFDSQVPYLEDPNTGVKMFESAYIIDYLRATYAL